MQIESTGQTYFGRVEVYFYASTDSSITASDTYLGQASVLLGGGEWATLTWAGALPTSLPQGAYYIGWRIDPDNRVSEANETNNTAYKSTRLLRVIGPSQPVIYVDANAHGANNGSSWKNAFARLQDALMMAEPGWEIRVADGTYTPDQGIGIAARDREASFKLSGNVTIRGGYSGAGAPDPNARNVQTYATVLSGDLKANDLPVADPCNGAPNVTNLVWIPDLSKEASRADNSRHVLTIIGQDQTITLDGVQVIGGYAGPFVVTPSGVSSDALTGTLQTSNSQGAGLFMAGGSLNLNNCTFSGNWASGDGGAIYVTDGRLELADCTFRANGTGLDSRIDQSRGTGGAIRSDGNSQMTLARCKFYNNFAGAQGGALDNDKGSTVLTRCLFVQNRAGAGGGALWNSAGRLNLVSCTLNGNRSNGSGAIVNAWNGILSAANCSLHANYGTIRAGAIHNFASGKATLWNCTLVANRQGIPGAIGCWPSYDQPGSELTIVNCILWNGGGELSTDDKSVVTIAHTDIQGGWPGIGNFIANPLFVQPAGPDGIAGTEDDNLRLGAASPCIDRGDNALLPQDFADLDGDSDLKEPLPLDLDGKQRVTGAAVDMGAYEVQPPSSSSPVSACSDG